MNDGLSLRSTVRCLLAALGLAVATTSDASADDVADLLSGKKITIHIACRAGAAELDDRAQSERQRHIPGGLSLSATGDR